MTAQIATEMGDALRRAPLTQGLYNLIAYWQAQLTLHADAKNVAREIDIYLAGRNGRVGENEKMLLRWKAQLAPTATTVIQPVPSFIPYIAEPRTEGFVRTAAKEGTYRGHRYRAGRNGWDLPVPIDTTPTHVEKG